MEPRFERPSDWLELEFEELFEFELDEPLELEFDELLELELDELLELEFEELLELELEELFELEFDELLELEFDDPFELEFDDPFELEFDELLEELLPANRSGFSSPDAPIPGSPGAAFGVRTILLMPPVSAACGAVAACETPAVPVTASASASSGLIPRTFFMMSPFVYRRGLRR